MQHDQSAPGGRLSHGVFQPHGFADAFGHHRLDCGLAKRTKHGLAETADKARHADEADDVDLCRLSVEKTNAGLTQDGADFVDDIALVIMIAENGDNGNGAGTQILRQGFRFSRFAEVREVAGQNRTSASPDASRNNSR